MNLKLNLLLALVLGLSVTGNAQIQYKIQAVPIQTRWAAQVSPANALPEYPRPQMVRANWTNLNGLWDYAITGKDESRPTAFADQILVPYPIESALSGVKKALLPTENLWYKRSFKAAVKPGEKTLLHFGAVDWEATVWLNGALVGSHKGGYTAFSFDITAALKAGDNELVVKVYDPTDQGYQPHGKQVLKPANIYYTPSSGIWQTVWLEQVPEVHIEGLVITPDVDKGLVNLEVKGEGKVIVTVFDNGKEVATSTASPRNDDGVSITMPIKNAKLWSPGSPFLYDLVVRLKIGNKVIDEVKSYFGMRKISIGKDAAGVDRICLNNKPYFNLGALDQGFWPDGLYTAPTDEALAFDIKAIKAMGFNTIRKHIKVEPARWYYWADKLGMLVWQDMVNPSQRLPERSKAEFEAESKEILSQLHNFPSITTWVLFNEKWGQYDQERLTKWIKQTDPSRLVNGHSGEYLYVNEKLRSPSPNAYVGADMTDVHSYPNPMNSLAMPGKARVLGEFGGIGVFIPDHQWNSANAWGYINEKPAALKGKYARMCDSLVVLQQQGLSASIYTQPFDVEGEQNGLMTYDREVIKVPFKELRQIHLGLNADLRDQEKDLSSLRFPRDDDKNNERGSTTGTVMAKDADLTDPALVLMERLKAKPDRALQVQLMKMIFADVIQEHVLTPDTKPNWEAIAEKVKPYGTAGEEIFLRAKTIHTYNQQDWKAFLPAAALYLSKYGSGLKENERTMFQKALDEHKDK